VNVEFFHVKFVGQSQELAIENVFNNPENIG